MLEFDMKRAAETKGFGLIYKSLIKTTLFHTNYLNKL